MNKECRVQRRERAIIDDLITPVWCGWWKVVAEQKKKQVKEQQESPKMTTAATSSISNLCKQAGGGGGCERLRGSFTYSKTLGESDRLHFATWPSCDQMMDEEMSTFGWKLFFLVAFSSPKNCLLACLVLFCVLFHLWWCDDVIPPQMEERRKAKLTPRRGIPLGGQSVRFTSLNYIGFEDLKCSHERITTTALLVCWSIVQRLDGREKKTTTCGCNNPIKLWFGHKFSTVRLDLVRSIDWLIDPNRVQTSKDGFLCAKNCLKLLIHQKLCAYAWVCSP